MQGETFSFREFCLHWRSEDAYENDRSCWWCDGLCPSIKTLTWSDPGVYLFAVKSATRIRYIVTRSWMISRWAWLKKNFVRQTGRPSAGDYMDFAPGECGSDPTQLAHGCELDPVGQILTKVPMRGVRISAPIMRFQV